jgi:branched-chain amino acid transport system substrate-binding protein
VAIVACDDAVDPARAARHLVDDVGVPAVVGFHGSQEVIDLATSVFIPSGVLAMATVNRSSLLATIPHAPGQPRLVWRTAINSDQSAEPTSHVVSDILEPELRALPGVLAPNEPIRVAFLHPRTTAGLSAADALFTKLTFNGKSALDNGASYRAFPHADASDLDAIDADTSLVPEIVKFRPHVVIHMGFAGITKHVLARIEDGWPTTEKFRPRFLSNGYLLGDDLFKHIGSDAERRRRFLGVNPTTSTVVNGKMTARYNDLFTPKVSVASGPAAVYDAFYVLAYAAYAGGDGPVTGASLARGIARLVPPGKPIDVGPTMIFQAFSTLRDGSNIDLNGAGSGLDFDLSTGDAPADFAVVCVKPDASGNAAEPVESGVVFVARTKKLEGLPLHCP